MYKAIVIEKMKQVFQDVPFGIEHTLKVLKNAEEIMVGENISADNRELVEIATILHDIGAIEAQRKYGSMDAHLQELEGPSTAKKILQEVKYEPAKISRVCYIVGNHHTPSKIDGIDFQIQWEADLLENLTAMEVINDAVKLKDFIAENFKTETGKAMAYERFLK